MTTQKTGSIGSFLNVHVIENFLPADVLAHWNQYAREAEYSKGTFAAHSNSSLLYQFDDCVKEIERIASYTFGVPLARYDGNGLLNKWSAGDLLVKHIDAPTNFEQYIGKNIEDPPSAILYSSIVYLNDDYDGGDIYFTEHSRVISPPAGSLLLFPATSMYPHEVTKVTSGNRYTFTLFLSNPDIMNMFRRLFAIADRHKY